YDVYRIRVSELMQKLFSEWRDDIVTPFDRYHKLQDFGDELRNKYYPHILSEAVIHEIKIEKGIDTSSKKNKKAFLVDQLK
ncbi:hypothetical protein, partial [Klebsiella pneumoniae]|uniref:hypothetical protein n=1 Tax=Klebsiella pneumoniae TaxID=573 RepID=UPI001C6A7C82